MFLAILVLLSAHPMSVSSTRVEVAGTRVEARIRCEDQTLRECLPLDENGDGRIDATELAAGRAAVARYVLDGWKLADGNGTPLAGDVVRIELVPDSSPRQIDIALRFAAERDLAGLTIGFALFRESDPFHRDHCEIVWNGAEPAGYLLWIEDPSWRFAPEAVASTAGAFDVFGAFVHHGVEHILLGYDHIAFVVALVLGARRWRSILAVVTAFTVAHSITLALAASGIVTLPASLVEPAIALSIAWVAARNLMSRTRRTPWIEAFCFGLIHGLGFAGAIGETLASEPRKLGALFGFNLGVEAGQMAVVAVLLVLFAAARSAARALQRSKDDLHRSEDVPQRGEDGLDGLAPRWMVSATSLVVVVLGVYWFVERVGP